MAWLIGRAVIRGEIDNTTEGMTTGRIWLLGRDEPLVLQLQGDCWSDLAGSRFEFENAEPELEPNVLAGLALRQRGLVGDITASRKTRGWIKPDFEPIAEVRHDPDALHNRLYVEWFSEESGRVVIESDQFEIHAGEPVWQMDIDAEQAQRLANMQAMRDYLAAVISRRESPDGGADEIRQASEHEWEQRLKEADRLTDAYQEALEKYADEPDSEQKEAFVMGWDGLLNALADQHESEQRSVKVEEPGSFEIGGSYDPVADEDDDDEISFEDDEMAGHPLQEQAQELAMRAFDLVRRDGRDDSPAGRLVSNLVGVSAKLAAALETEEDDYQPEAGYVLAVLKRCLHLLNEGIAACLELIACEEDPDHRRALEAMQQEIFEVRDEIVELRRNLRRG